MLFKDKSLMIPKDQRVPAWIRKSYHKIIRRLAFQQNKPIAYFVDEALGEWLIKNNLKK